MPTTNDVLSQEVITARGLIGYGLNHVTSDVAYGQIATRLGTQEVDDAVAITIASWFAGHDASGRISWPSCPPPRGCA